MNGPAESICSKTTRSGRQPWAAASIPSVSRSPSAANTRATSSIARLGSSTNSSWIEAKSPNRSFSRTVVPKNFIMSSPGAASTAGSPACAARSTTSPVLATSTS